MVEFFIVAYLSEKGAVVKQSFGTVVSRSLQNMGNFWVISQYVGANHDAPAVLRQPFFRL